MPGIKGRYLDYECSKGHEMTSPWPEQKVLAEGCRVYVKGKPCDGELKRVNRRKR